VRGRRYRELARRALSGAALTGTPENGLPHASDSGVACAQCELLDRTETDCLRRLDAAQSRLHAFCPEPPYTEATVSELRRCQHAVEDARLALDNAKRERNAHFETHAMTLSR